MREIKFRMFDNKRMVYFDLDDVYYNKVTPDNGVNEPLIMQYTGLYDKSGKEIYEGDIMQCDFSFYNKDSDKTQEQSIGVVGFREGEFYITFGFNTIHGYNISSGFKIAWLRDGARSEWRDFEIIGNVYENPDLIK